MVFLRKFTLVIAEIILFLLITVLLAAPHLMLDVAEFMISFDLTIRVITVVVIDLLIFLAIISQLRGGVNYRGPQLLVQAGDSNTTVTTESVRLSIMKAIQDIDAIESVTCEVKGKHGDAIIKMEVITSKDDINIPNKQKEIDRAIKRVVVKQMGVKLSKPAVVNIRLASDAQQENESSTPTPVVEPASAPVASSVASSPRQYSEPTPAATQPDTTDTQTSEDSSTSISGALVPPKKSETDPVEPNI